MRNASQALRAIVAHFDYLAARWQDEQEYEQFEEYRDAMAKFLEKHGAGLLQMSPDPWVLVFAYKGLEHKLALVEDAIELSIRPQVH